MDPDRGTSAPEHPRLADIAGGRFADLFSRWSDAEFLAHDFFRAAPPEGVAAEDLPVLRAYHRLLRAYPDADAADVLYGRGFHSAHQVAAMAEHRFVREHAQALGGDDVARAVHRGARHARARARLVGAAVRDLAGSAHFRATRFYNGSTETVGYYTDVPSYQDFFGGVYYVTCPDCASVLGPAAYFLDLMRIADFYVGDPNRGTIPPGWELEVRRPDLFHALLLDCDNSTATQPVLVIVNEILQAHLEAALAVDDLWRDVFPAAQYPFNQPFALPLAQLRATLPQLRATLAEVWADYGAGADAVARESLQLSIEQKRDLATPHLTPDALWPFYGWDDAGDHLAQLAEVEIFLQRTGLVRPQLVSLLDQETDSEEFAAVAPTFFINHTGETVPGTEDPLPPLRLVLDTTDPAAPVERIENLTLARADRVMRFVRLRQHLGWSYASLDWAMKAVVDPADAADPLAQAFDALALVQQLRTRLRLEPDVLAGFWYEVKPIGRVSAEHPQDLFDRTFNSPVLLAGRDPYAPSAVGVPFDPARPIAWNPAGTAGLDLEVRSRLTAALGVTDNDLTAAAAFLNCLRGEAADAPIDTTLESLSSLFRLTRLPQALGLAAGAYLTMLRAMYGPDEACVDRPAGAPRLTPLSVAAQAEVAAWLALSGWTPYDLQYAITGAAGPQVDSDFDPARVRPFVDSLATAAESSRLTAESFVFANVDADESVRVFDGLVAEGSLTPAGVLRTPVGTAGAGVSWEQLAALLPVTADTFLVGQLPPTGVPDPDAITAEEARQTLELLLGHGVLLPVEGVPEGAAGALAEDFTAATDLSYLFPDEEDEQAAQHKRDEVRDDLLQARGDVAHSLDVLDEAWRLQDANATGGVAQFFGVESEKAAVLVPFAAPLAEVDEVLAALLTPFPPDPLPPAETQRLARVEELFRLLARLLFVLEKLGYSAEEAAGVATDPAAFGIPPGDLDVAAVQSLWTFKALTAAFRDRDDRLLQYLLMPDATEAEVTAKLAALSALTGWPEPQIATLVETLWEDGSDAWATVFGVARLKRAFDRSAATGANVDTLLAVEALSGLPLAVDGATDPAAWTAYRNAAGTVLDLVNARYRGSERDQVNESIQDTLVTQQRNVLLPYALWTLAPVLLPADAAAAGALPTPEDVYEYLLIDVQTSNCDRVSRIAQGVASVQLYLQRARLNLEPGVEQIPVPAVWWEWLASYGTWGANRRIFLYPENYVDPSLRRSATPIYRQLQESLLQAELAEDTVEAAYRDYLDGFAAAAELRIVGVFRHVESDGGDTLFQFARTSDEPYVYYHRTLQHYAIETTPGDTRTGRSVGAWSAWEEVGVTIPSEFVTPVYAFGRLMVFWVEQETTSGSYVQNQESQEYEVTRAAIKYSFRNFRGEWAAPQTLAGDIVVSVQPDVYAVQLSASSYFDPRSLYWRKVLVMLVPAGRYAGPVPFSASEAPLDNAEQLLVFYGAWLQYTSQTTYRTDIAPPADDPVPARRALNAELYAVQQMRRTLSEMDGASPGNVPLKPVLAVGFNLDVQTFQAVILDSPVYPLVQVIGYSGFVYSARRTLELLEFPNLLWTEHRDSVTENPPPVAQVQATAHEMMSATTTEAPVSSPGEQISVMLANLSAVNTAKTEVKNQPEWFVYDNGNDVFLAAWQQAGVRQLSAILQAYVEFPPYPPGPIYLWTYPYTASGNNPDPEQMVFAFTRLGTHTVQELSRLLRAGGIDLLLTPTAQQAPELPLRRLYPDGVQSINVLDATTDRLDFDGAYGPYFWEVFFYTVFLVAERLSGDRRFAEAKRWYEYVFDPMAEGGSTDPELYWRFLPFRAQTPEALEASLTSVAQIAAYNDDPFDPDAIARLRPGAYPRAMVLRYVRNLIDWGDALFTQDTRETVTQATLLYVLAGDLLGKPAVNLGTFRIAVPKTYAEIRDAYDTSGTAQGGSASTIVLAADASDHDAYYNGLTVQVTGGAGSGQSRTVTAYAGASRTATVAPPWGTAPAAGSTYQILGIPQFLIEVENAPAAAENAAGLAPEDVPFVDADPYFCVPENQELTALWETLADRLLKIRHCMNIRGVERQLAQFEPPLDPRALMAGAPAGGAPPVQQAPGAAIPFYRFQVMMEQARALAAATAQLGSSLLGALQSLDAEELSLLSVTQQKALLSLTTRLYEDQVEAARWQVRVVEEGQAGAQARLDYYTALLAVGLSPAELANLAAMEAGLVANVRAGATRALASAGYGIPQLGSPYAITYGGQQVGAMLTAAAGVFEIVSTVAAYVAQRAGTMAGYGRRTQEWELQRTLAGQDLAAAGDSLEAARLQVRIAERNLEVHRRTLAQNQETEEFLRRKFTSRELYQWLSSRLSSLHFQTFSLAYGAALSAQQAFQYELDSQQTFVNFGYWSAPHRGLLAGEGLLLALNQMDAAYLAGSGRPLEIERTLSLLQSNPRALLELRETGECAFELSERLFDQDFPGHYARKIRTVSVSIPAVVGPYQNVKATLTQTSNQVVMGPYPDAVRYLLGAEDGAAGPQAPPPAGQLRANWWNRQAIALSSGVNDDGMFVLSFQDPRYLPFEGTGAVSTWRLSMPKAANRFDYEALSDVVVRVSYTARDGGEAFRQAVTAIPQVKEYAAARYFDLAQQYPDAWYAFLRDHTDPAAQSLAFAIAALAPPQVAGVTPSHVFVQLQVAGDADAEGTYLSLAQPGGAPQPVPIGAGNHSSTEPLASTTYTGSWTLSFDLEAAPAALTTDGFLDPAKLLDVQLIVYYSGELDWGPAPSSPAVRAVRWG